MTSCSADKQPLRRELLPFSTSNTDPFSGQAAHRAVRRTRVRGAEPAAASRFRTQEMDDVYALPYHAAPITRPMQGGRRARPSRRYSSASSATAAASAACSFCALTFHQGRIIQTRSHESLLTEASAHDAAIPISRATSTTWAARRPISASPACEKQLTHGACQNRQCLFPTPCRNLRADHSGLCTRCCASCAPSPGVKKVFIRSGIRFDYLLADEDATLPERAGASITSRGQLKVAPEHVSDQVLRYMGKPRHAVYEQLLPQICTR